MRSSRQSIVRRSPSRYRPGFVSLERALSKLGAATRAEARALIVEGRVTVEGRVVRDPAHPAQPERQTLRVDRRTIARTTCVLIMLNKPRGTVTTLRDPEGRRTVYDLVKDAPARVLAVGRLDWATSGLLLFTNDSKLAAWLTDPANMLPRVYRVTVRGALSPARAERLGEGLVVDGDRLTAHARVLKQSGRETHLVVTLTEGKNREVRRLFAAVGHEVTSLTRVSFGGLTLGRLPRGAWRVVSPKELERATGWRGSATAQAGTSRA